MSLLLDGIVVALIVLGAVLGVKRGFVRTVIEVAGYVLILLIATSFAGTVGDAVYAGAVRPAVENAVVSGIGGSDTTDVEETVDRTFEALPGPTANLLRFFDVTPERVKTTLGDTSQTAAATIAAKVGDLAAPPLTMVIRVLFVALLFVLGLFLIRLLAGFCNSVAKHIPVVGALNAWLGGAVGLVKGLVFAFVGANLLMLLLSLTGGELFGLTAEQVDHTLLFSRLCWLIHS